MISTIIEAVGDILEFVALPLYDWRRRKRARAEGKKKPISINAVVLSIIVILAISLVLIGIAISWPSGTIPATQIDEMDSIVRSLNSYKDYHGSYPKDVNLLIQGVPIRKRWLFDYWGSEYAYKVLGNGELFELRSPGRDKRLGTEDDLVRPSKSIKEQN